jgi:hypothetical protein
MEFTKAEQDYFKVLILQVVTTHGDKALEVFTADPMGTIKKAHEERQAFLQELVDNTTAKAVEFRSALVSDLWNHFNGR